MKKIGIFLFTSLLFFCGYSQKPINIGVYEEINSSILNEKRILNIYLPEGYNKDSVQCNVVYLLDGSLDEDFLHVSGIVQYHSFSWFNRMSNTIVVGISNVDRKRDYTFPTAVTSDKEKFPTTGGSEKFIAFIEQEVQPFIEKKYNTSATKTLIGQSLGGLLATEILFKKPQLFSHYLIVSPSLWWDKESLLKMSKATIQNKTKVHVCVGKEGAVMVRDAKKLAQLLSKNPNIELSFNYLSKEDHASIGHLAFFYGLRSLFPIQSK